MQDERARIVALIKALRQELEDRDPPALRPLTKRSRALNAIIDEVLVKLKASYLACQKDRRKAAIYPYLEAVYAFGLRFEEIGQSRYLMEQAVRTGGPKARRYDTVFSYLLRATSTANRKTRNTWVQALKIAHSRQEDDGDLANIFGGADGLKNYIRAFAGRGVNETGDEDNGWGDEDFDLSDHAQRDFQRSVPAAPKVILKEAIRCFNITAYTAAVMMCSLTLRRACAARGVEVDGEDIGAALDGLRESGLVDANLVNQSRDNAVHVMGMVYAGQTLVTRKEAGELLQFTRAVVDALFP